MNQNNITKTSGSEFPSESFILQEYGRKTITLYMPCFLYILSKCPLLATEEKEYWSKKNNYFDDVSV